MNTPLQYIREYIEEMPDRWVATEGFPLDPSRIKEECTYNLPPFKLKADGAEEILLAGWRYIPATLLGDISTT